MEAGGEFHASLVLSPKNELWCPLYGGLCWRQSWPGRCGEKKIIARVVIRTPALHPIARLPINYIQPVRDYLTRMSSSTGVYK
jgi:hypothetical protein